MKINYTFIIPHKNTPQSLNRCVSSIPTRDDVEVIVLDDNSEETKKANIKRKDVHVILISSNESNGAGKARNIGIKMAKGKWVIFADADDYFVPEVLTILDKYLYSDVDVVYHPALSVDYLTDKPLPEFLCSHNNLFELYNNDDYTANMIKYKLHSPWWKVVKKSFVDRYSISFEEVPKGNDVFYTYQVGYFADKIAIEKSPIYVHTYNTSGISFGRKSLKVRTWCLIQRYRINTFYDFIGYPKWKKNVIKDFYEILRDDNCWLLCQTVFYFLTHYSLIKESKNFYVDELKKMSRHSS